MHQHVILADELVTVTRTHYKEGHIIPAHSHDFSSISLILKGRFSEISQGHTDQICRSKTLIKPTGTPHENRFDSDSLILSIQLNAEEILPDKGRLYRERNSVYGLEWASFQPYFSCKSLKEKKETLQFFFNSLERTRKNKSETPVWLFQLKEMLDEGFDEVVKTSDLADQFEVHPVHLARVFRKYFGHGIKEYLRSLRIKSSMASIIENERTLTQVAFQNGFADQSHFIRNFKVAAGTTPKKFKKQLG